MKSKSLVLFVWLFVLVIFFIGIIYWVKNKQLVTEQNLRQQIGLLQDQLLMIKNENDNLMTQNTKVDFGDNLDFCYEVVGEKCTTEECLFKTKGDNYPLGLSIIKGYYTPVERSAWGETEVCDSFTITSGSSELIQAMINLVDNGNTVHNKNQLNQPVINLGLELISESEEQKIFSSSDDNQIELLVQTISPKRTEASVCYHDVIVQRIK